MAGHFDQDWWWKLKNWRLFDSGQIFNQSGFFDSVSSPFGMQVFGLYIDGQKQYFENNEEIFVINAIALQHCATES